MVVSNPAYHTPGGEHFARTNRQTIVQRATLQLAPARPARERPRRDQTRQPVEGVSRPAPHRSAKTSGHMVAEVGLPGTTALNERLQQGALGLNRMHQVVPGPVVQQLLQRHQPQFLMPRLAL